MNDAATTSERARDAAAGADWALAVELFTKADADGELGLEDIPAYAEVAYAAGHLERCVELWERAHSEFLAAGIVIAAAGAAVQVAMHLLIDTALMAPVRGWLSRAEGLLTGHDPTPAHAWHAVGRSYERLLSGDLVGARVAARLAIEIGSSCDPAACAIGRVADARLRILDGDLEEGLALLDAAGGAAVSGQLDPLSTGIVYCELVCALQGLAMYDLAEQWTEAMERWSATDAVGSIRGRCRVHRAEILRLRGRWSEAEDEALAALDELRPYLRRELGWPLSELGRIRLRRGDLAGAEAALLAAHHAGWDSEPGLALVRLAQGDTAAAVGLIRDAIERPLPVPSKELPPHTELRRAPLLEAQVEIELATGDIERARSAASELSGIAARFQSRALLASATQSDALVRLADGDTVTAAHLFAGAAREWDEIGAPYEAALARLRLADAHEHRGDDDRANLERHEAQRILDALAAAGPPRTASPAGTTALFRRELDLWAVTFDGRTVHLRDIKGMRYLARLLADPGAELHVLDLVAAEAGDASPLRHRLGDAGAFLDPEAKNAYQRRLAEIDEDIELARAACDAVREETAEAERDFLVRELSRAVGLGGRDRKAGAGSERARAGVTRAIRQAMARIDEGHPDLGGHLSRTIRTGTYCAYLPDPRAPVAWLS
jgi:tetratricopeptide (TPR) repeat protein